MEQVGQLTGSVVLVTGAAGVIGHALISAFKQQGAQVIGADLRSSDGPVLCDEWHALDVASEEQWSDTIAAVRRSFGALHVLINNAGLAPIGRLEDTSLAEWRRCQSINVDGAFIGMKTALPLLRESGAERVGGSVIINIASGAADRPASFAAAYSTSKAAVAMLTRAAAVELGQLGYPVRVNSVHPGSVSSTMMTSIAERFVELGVASSVEDMEQAIASGAPMKRYVTPEEVADAAVFLASPQARFIHGEALHVDGGYAAA